MLSEEEGFDSRDTEAIVACARSIGFPVVLYAENVLRTGTYSMRVGDEETLRSELSVVEGLYLIARVTLSKPGKQNGQYPE